MSDTAPLWDEYYAIAAELAQLQRRLRRLEKQLDGTEAKTA
ncbi:MAG: hypothetical protein ACRDYV_10750 [Acidimicrobiia bacterium]